MPRIAFVTDSTSYIPQDLIQKYDIKVAPQVLIWGNEQLLDGVDITPDQFYARLKTAEVMPTTSEVNAGTFKTILDPLVAQGLPVVMVLISSKLSGTINSAQHAKEMLPAGARVEIVDSEATSMALGFQVLAAARTAEAGKSLDEVVRVARKAKEHTGVFFVVDTLEFLHRGGRIGGASKLFGTALNIKPLLELRDGRVEPVERIRTKAKALARLLDVLEERIGGRKPVRLCAIHAAAEDEARALLEKAEKRFGPVESFISPASPVVGAQAGPGTVGMAFSFGV
ncbi:MAG TPA: DegV family protein [Anaerolineales bacterium]|nr:DegV family protein [Anaerolineales bacterium]